MTNQSLMEKETRRLYFEDAYQLEFKARVVERKIHEGQPALILNQTCFYPDSGGQPSDRGMIESVEVLNVLEEEGRILHILKENILSEEVKGKIDWNLRFDHMQQHSGQHILSQSFYECLGGETLSFHLGEELSTVEIGVTKISEEDVERVEKRSNDIIFQNLPIKIYFIPEEKIKEIPLRKPPKKEGLIRVVEVSGFDYSACGGTHCRSAGEIGIIKVLNWERIRNNLRFEFVCGQRALRDYAWRNSDLRQLASQFSVHEKEVFSWVQKTIEEMKALRKKMKKLGEKVSFFEAQEVVRNAKGKIIQEILLERTPEEARHLSLNIIRQGDFVILYGVKGEERDHLIFACSENLRLDMRELVPVISPLIKGKGGGSPSLVEIVTEERGKLELALTRAHDIVKLKM
jgi:alanyl-tRNA synthetase